MGEVEEMMCVVCVSLLKIVFFSLGVLKYIVCLCRGCDLFFSLFMLTCHMMRFLSLLLLGLCACVVFVVLW